MNFGSKKPGRDGEWTVILTKKNKDGETVPVGRGQYWVRADGHGGWTRMLNKLSAHSIKMDGQRAAKTDASILDGMRDTQAALQLKGMSVEVPTCSITYTQLVKELIEKRELPDPIAAPPQPGEPAIVNVSQPPVPTAQPQEPIDVPVEAPQTESVVTISESAPPNTQPTPSGNGRITSEQMSTALASISPPPSAGNSNQVSLSTAFSQEAEENLNLVLNNPNGDSPPSPNTEATDADVDLLTARLDLMETRNLELDSQVKYLTEQNLRLEQNAASGQVDYSDKILNTMRGSLDAGLTRFASAMEHRIQREMGHVLESLQRNSTNITKEVIQDVLEDVVQRMVLTTVDCLSEQVSGVTTALTSNTDLLNNISKKIEELDTNQAKIFSRLGQLGTNVDEKLKVSRAMSDIKSSSSSSVLVTPPSRPSNPPPPKCSWCLKTGHAYTACNARPRDYSCLRCRSPRHHIDHCPTKEIACTKPGCGELGHHAVIHQTTDPAVRMNIIQFFGIEKFQEFLSPPNVAASKRLKYSPN